MAAKTHTLIIGTGDGGIHTLNRVMFEGLHGLKYLGVNTHRQTQPDYSAYFLQIGERGHGAAGQAILGKEAAKSSAGELFDLMNGVKRIVLTGGLGGGTASGALPVMATIGRECGAEVHVVVSKPFLFEGSFRRENATKAADQMRERVESLSVIACDDVLALSAEPSAPAIPQIYELVSRALAWHILAGLV